MHLHGVELFDSGQHLCLNFCGYLGILGTRSILLIIGKLCLNGWVTLCKETEKTFMKSDHQRTLQGVHLYSLR